MAARVIYLAMVATGAWPADHEGVMPGNALCLTFTNKATENLILKMRRALRTLDLDEGEEPEISNYHAFAAQVLERHGMLIGLEPGQRVLSQAQRAQIAARVLDRMTFEKLHTRWQPAIVGYILGLDEQLQNHLVEPEMVIDHVEGKLDALRKARSAEPLLAAEERIEIARAVRVFRDLKAELGVIDFGDQIAHAVRIASAHPDVGKAYRDRFGAVLLDEYQDTNHAQAVLMRAVFGDGHPVTAVGDPDQNIYAWRGASLWNLLHFRKEFPLPRRGRVRAAAAVHELPLRGPDPRGGRPRDRRPAREPAPRPRQAPPPLGTQRRGARRGRALRARDRGGRGRRRTRPRAARGRRRVARDGRPVPDPPVVRGVAARVRRRWRCPPSS